MLDIGKEIVASALQGLDSLRELNFLDSIKTSAIYDIGKFGLVQAVKRAVQRKKKPSAEPVCEIPNHIRRLCTEQEYSGGKVKAGENYAFSLLDYCMEYPYVALLGEAGCGKTQELRWIEYCCSKDEDLPRTVRISLRTYSGESVTQLAEQYGVKPGDQENLFFLIDGFDEIAGADKQNFLKQVELYHRENKEARFLISMRNHFYMSGLLGKEFRVVWMQPLTEGDIRDYVEQQKIAYEDWSKQVKEQRLTEAVKNPFYLTELCQIYLECGTLPEREALMKTLTEQKISQDLDKYRMTGKLEFQEAVEEAKALLERLAVAMQAMDTRVLTESEYERLIPGAEKRELLRYSGIWVQRNGNWEFSHNNFGEYLAANYLSGCPLYQIQNLVCMGHPKLGLSPNWHHVLTYLFSDCRNEVRDWLLQQDVTVFLEMDWSKIPESDRSRILLREWEKIKQEHIWAQDQNYRLRELVEFGMDYNALHVFLDEIRDPWDSISLKNAIQILGYSPNLYGCQQETRMLLLSVLLKEQQDKKLQDTKLQERALVSLLNLELMDSETLSVLLEQFWESDASEIRYPLYAAIRELGQADAQIAFLLDGLPYIAELRQNRLGNEAFELHYALFSVSGVPAARRVMEALISDRHYSHIYKIAEVLKHAVSCMEAAYTGQEDENWLFMEQHYRKICLTAEYSAELVVSYFEHTGTKTRLFCNLLKTVAPEKGYYEQLHLLSPLLDEHISEWVLEQYREKNLKDEEVSCCLNLMRTEDAFFEQLCILYGERAGTELKVKKASDRETERQECKERYEQAVCDQEVYIGLLEKFLCIMNKNDMSLEELDEVEQKFDRTVDREDLQNVCMDYRRYAGKQKTMRQWIETLRGEDDAWEWLQVHMIEEWMRQNTKCEILPSMREAAFTFYEKYIGQVDFSACQIWTDHEHFYPTDWKCEFLIYFANRLDLPMTSEKAKELLFYCSLFSDIETGHIIRKYVPEEVLRQEVSHNLLEKELKGYPLSLHIKLCGEFQCRACTEKVRKTALNPEIPEYIRIDAVETFEKLTDERTVCTLLLPSLSGSVWVQAVKNLMQAIAEKRETDSGEESWRPLLANQIWKFGKNEETYRILAYKWLIQLQDLRGLRAYRELLEQIMAVPGQGDQARADEAVAMVENPKLWPELARLTDICFDPKFKDREYGGLFHSLNRAWPNIAGGSEEGYRFMMEVMEKLESRYEEDRNRKAWIHMWMKNGTEAHQRSVQKPWEIGRVVRWMEDVKNAES